MGLLDDAKDKIEDIKDDAVNKFHEEKGRMEERQDQAEADKAREQELDDDPYEPEERLV
jgi:hypothetical protein